MKLNEQSRKVCDTGCFIKGPSGPLFHTLYCSIFTYSSICGDTVLNFDGGVDDADEKSKFRSETPNFNA
jgi:hypothetical protein